MHAPYCISPTACMHLRCCNFVLQGPLSDLVPLTALANLEVFTLHRSGAAVSGGGACAHSQRPRLKARGLPA